jgi:hypothetical protein
MKKICGFAVVKCAKYNFFEDYLMPPRIGDIYYHGIGRLWWNSDIDDKDLPLHYKKQSNLLDITSVIWLTKEFEVAHDLLSYSNKDELSNEIITIYSEKLEKTYGSFIPDLEIKWLGEDIISGLTGSMLLEGIFTKPDIFSNFISSLNQYGLFNINSPLTDLYIKDYIVKEQLHNLEIFSDHIDSLYKAWVGVPKI